MRVIKTHTTAFATALSKTVQVSKQRSDVPEFSDANARLYMYNLLTNQRNVTVTYGVEIKINGHLRLIKAVLFKL